MSPLAAPYLIFRGALAHHACEASQARQSAEECCIIRGTGSSFCLPEGCCPYKGCLQSRFLHFFNLENCVANLTALVQVHGSRGSEVSSRAGV